MKNKKVRDISYEFVIVKALEIKDWTRRTQNPEIIRYQPSSWNNSFLLMNHSFHASKDAKEEIEKHLHERELHLLS